MQPNKWKEIKHKLREIYNQNSLEPELIWGEHWFYNTIDSADFGKKSVSYKAICPNGKCLGVVVKKIETKWG